MIDNISIWYEHDYEWHRVQEELKLPSCKIQLDPQISKGRVTHLVGLDELGLRHVLTPSKHSINNSIHKAYSTLNGESHNHTQFLYKDFCFIANYICQKHKLDSTRLFISKLEIGLNLKMDQEAILYIHKAHSHNLNPLRTLLKGHTEYGKKVFMSKEQIKIYDKSKQIYLADGIKLDHNILRIEAVLKKTVLLKEVAPTLDAILNPINYQKLLDHLSHRYSQFEFKQAYDLSQLKSTELTNYYAGKSIDFWQNLKNNSPKNTYKTSRQRYKNLLKKLDSNHINDPLLTELRRKFNKAVFDQF